MDAEQLAYMALQLDGNPVPGVRMTERQFVEWAFERVDAEWVNGEVILMAPASDAHSDLDVWVGSLIHQFNEARQLGVVRRDMFIRFARRKQRRVPDVMFISNARRQRIRSTYIDGAPDLIVEIVSPDSRNRDRRDKYFAYEAGGVREYWIIDPLLETLDVYALRGRKFEEITPVDDRIDSRVLPGLFLRSKWLFGKQRPKVSQVLKEYGVKL
jgi:Uma2 family endonuclease